jgi:hypothetical protein
MNMTQSDINYINGQILKACPFPLHSGDNGQIKIKIHSERGETNWLNLTPEQLKKIELVLLGV